MIAPILGVGPRATRYRSKSSFPVLSVYRANSTDEALRVCIDVNHAGGLGHTAVIFSRNDEIVRKFSDVMDAGRIIVNSPGSIGALGGVYNDMVPTFSFGCGTGGGNSTTDNVNLYHYLNLKRVARRTQAHMWFRVPNQIYFNMNAVENLRQFPSRSTLIVTNPMLEQMGLCGRGAACNSGRDVRPRPRHPRRRAGGQGRDAWRGGAQPAPEPTRSSPWVAGP